MFGYHDDRNNENNLIPQLTSLASFGAFAYWAHRWLGRYGYKTRVVIGIPITYPAQPKRVFDETYRRVQQFFPTRDPVREVREYDKYWNYVNRSPLAHEQTDGLLDSIEALKGTLRVAQKDIRAHVGDIARHLETNKTAYKLTGSADEKGIALLDTYLDELNALTFDDLTDLVFARVKHKFPAEDLTNLRVTDPDVLRELKSRFQEAINEARSTADFFGRIAQAPYHYTPQTIAGSMTEIRDRLNDLYRANVYNRKVFGPPEISGIALDIKAAVREFPEIKSEKDISGRDFLKKLLGDKPFYSDIWDHLGHTGIRPGGEMLISKAAEDLANAKRLLNVMPEEFGYHVHRIIKKLDGYVSLGRVKGVDVAWMDYAGEKNLVFKIKTAGPKGSLNEGGFTFSLALPTEGVYGTQIPYPHRDVLRAQVDTVTRNLDAMVKGSLDSEARTTLQPLINRWQNRTLAGIPSSDNPLENLYRTATFGGNYLSMLRSRIGYTGDKGVLAGAWDEMAAFKQSNLVHYFDLEFGDITRPDGTKEQVIKDITVITQERLDNGRIRVKKSWTAKTENNRYRLTDFEFKVKHEIGQTQAVDRKARTLVNEHKVAWVSNDELMKRVNEYLGTPGVVVSKALKMKGGDLDQLRSFLDKYKERHGMNIDGALKALSKGNIVDSQKFMRIQFTDLPLNMYEGGGTIENTAEMVQDLLDYFRRTTPQMYNQALAYVEGVERIMFKRPFSDIERRTMKVPHISRYDATYALIHSTLICDFRYKGINSRKQFNRALEDLSPAFEEQRTRTILSSSVAAAGKTNYLRPEVIFPMYELGTPRINKMYQFLIASKTEFGPKSGVRKTLPMTVAGSEKYMETYEFKDTLHAITTFLDPAMGYGEGEVWAEKHFVGSMRTHDHKQVYYVDEFHKTFTHQIGTVVEPTVDGTPRIIGYRDNEPVYYGGKFKFKIINRAGRSKEGKLMLEVVELIDAGIGTKMGLATTGAGLSITQMFDGGSMPYRFQAAYRPDIFKRDDHVALFKTLCGRLELYYDSADHQTRKLIHEKIRQHLKDPAGRAILTPVVEKGELTLKYDPAAFNLGKVQENDVRFLLNRIFRVFKEVGLQQKNTVGDFDYLAKAAGLAKGGSMVELKKEVIKTMAGSMYTLMRESPRLSQVFLDEWLGDQYSAAEKQNAKDVLAGKADLGAFERLLENGELPHFLDVARYGPAGHKFLRAGLMAPEGSWNSSTIPAWATRAGVVKVGNWHLALLGRSYGTEKFRNSLIEMINQQSGHLVGHGAYFYRVGTGQENAHGFNLLSYVDELEKGLHSEQERVAYRAFLDEKSSYARFQHEVAYKYEGKTYTSERQLFAEHPYLERDPEELNLVETIDLSQRVRRKEATKFVGMLRQKADASGGAYMPLPKAVYMQVAGRYGRPMNVLQFTAEGFSSYPIKRDGRDFAIMSEQGIMLHNALTKRSDPLALRGALQQYWDTVESGIGKNLRYAYAPGANALVQFGKEFRYDVAGKALTEYTEDSVLRNEMVLSRDWITRHARQFNRALDGMNADEFRYVARYMRDYAGTVRGGTPDGFMRHPALDAKTTLGSRARFEQQTGRSADELLDMMAMAKKGQDLTEVRKLYKTALEKEFMPLHTEFWKAPFTKSSTFVSTMTFFRDIRLPRSGAEVVGLISQVAASMGKIDQDGDWVSVMMAPKGFRKMHLASVNAKPEHMAMLQYAGQEELGGEPAFMFFNKKINGVEAVPLSQGIELIKKDVHTNLELTFGPEEARNYLQRLVHIKTGAPEATKFIYTTAELMSTVGKGWSKKSFQSLMDTYAVTGEWSIAQKRKAHDVTRLFSMIHDLNKPGMAKELEGIINNPEYASKLGLGDLKDLLKDVPDDIQGSLTSWYSELGKKRGVYGTGNIANVSDLQHPFSHLALLRMAQAKYPGMTKFGDLDYRLKLGTTGTMGNMYHANFLNHFLDDMPREYQMPPGIPFDRPEESFGKNFKRAVVKSGGEQIWANAARASKIGVAALGVYALANLFRPNQTGFLGHMPGKGGEYYDWNFANPEMAWSDLMRTPLDTAYQDPVRLQGYDPRLLDQALRRRDRSDRRDLPVPTARDLAPQAIHRSIIEF